MREYVLNENYRILQSEGTPLGVQEKYSRNNYWYKVDKSGREGLTENIVSILLRCSTLPENCYVYYEVCRVNGKNGCRSKSFLKNPYEAFIPFESLGKSFYGKSLSDTIQKYNNTADRLNILLNLGNAVGLNLNYYFKVMMFLDLLIYNRDRHTRNYGVIYDGNLNKYRIPPIFDNGLSLNTGLSVSEKVHSVTLSGSFEQQVTAFGYPVKSPFLIDYQEVFKRLKNFNCVEKDVLFKRMFEYENIFKK